MDSDLHVSHTLLVSLEDYRLTSYVDCVTKQAALDEGVKTSYGLNKRVEAVDSNVRKLTKLDMKLNNALPQITLDPETYTVTANGGVLSCTATASIPLSRNYFLF